MKKILTLILVGFFLLYGVTAFGTIENGAVMNQVEQKYVIITINELVDAVESLKIWKEFLGYSVEIVTLESISTSFQGGDIQEKIRNCLIEKYQGGTINYVLLVGSRNSIPMRTCFPIPQEFDDVFLETDYYYSDLSGDWNADHDTYFGEYGDDHVDFTPEVFVGRLPSDDQDTVKQICRNIIKFESDTGVWKKNALLLASIIYYENLEAFDWTYARSDGATLMEKCRSDIFEPNEFSCVTMYEKEGIRPSEYNCNYPLNRENTLSEWTNGYGIVNMIGHADERHITRFIWSNDDGDNIPEFDGGELTYIDILRSSDSDELSLKTPPIVFSAGCSQLHTSRNMGKEFIEDGAAVAFIGSTDLGLYNITRIWNDENDGGCFSLDYYFFNFLIKYNQKCGNALASSKEYFSNHFMFTEYNPDWIYRCYSTLYGFTLYGDPSMGITTEKTDTISPTIHIDKPKGHLYIFDKEIFSLPANRTIILGKISLTFSVDDEESDIEKSEIFIDDTLANTTEEKYFTWLWDEIAIGKHTIQVITYDNAGNIATDNLQVIIFNT